MELLLKHLRDEDEDLRLRHRRRPTLEEDPISRPESGIAGGKQGYFGVGKKGAGLGVDFGFATGGGGTKFGFKGGEYR